MIKKLYIGLFLVAISTAHILAQEEKKEPSIRVMAHAYYDSIAIRWAPDNPVAWQLLNKYGYFMERYTLMQDGKVQDDPEFISFFSQPLKPRPVEDWEGVIDQDDYIAIAAQAIYGETFELSTGHSPGVMQVINKSREVEQRFSFALFSADMSKVAAHYAALGHVDKSVKKSEKYVYKIYSAVPSNILEIDTGYVFVGLDDHRPLPRPRYLEAQTGDRAAMISWNHSYFKDLYVAYRLERSDDDGKTYSPVTDLPIVNTEAREGMKSGRTYKLDSLPGNYKSYYYRVRGITPFGDYGPSSDTLVVMGKQPLTAYPMINGHEISEKEDRVGLSWEFDPTFESQVKGFEVIRSNKANTGYAVISESNIPSQVRDFEDTSPRSTNYYKIVAIGLGGERKESHPYLVQLQDSIPPAIPGNIKARIDSSGLVTLQWAPNTENDLLGYRVYRANFKNNEFTQITHEAIAASNFQDTVTLNTLTEKIYYKILAVDQRFNPSGMSKAVEINRPDVIPPVSPVITRVVSADDGVKLEWTRSSSEDVIAHRIYRRHENSRGWTLIRSFDDTTTFYVDDTQLLPSRYLYTMIAIDDAQLESKPAKPVWGKLLDRGIRPEIEDIIVVVDRLEKEVRLTWQYDNPGLKSYLVYRSESGEPLTLYRSIEATAFGFRDQDLVENTSYKYRVKAVYKNGAESRFSDEVMVRY